MAIATATGTGRRDHAIAVSGTRPVVAAIREGDAVLAEDGFLGRVDRLLRSERRVPAYLVVRTRRTLRRRYPVVPVSLVADVNSRRRRVELHGTCETIGRLSETLPLVL
jgi:hypothetical protein